MSLLCPIPRTPDCAPFVDSFLRNVDIGSLGPHFVVAPGIDEFIVLVHAGNSPLVTLSLTSILEIPMEIITCSISTF